MRQKRICASLLQRLVLAMIPVAKTQIVSAREGGEAGSEGAAGGGGFGGAGGGGGFGGWWYGRLAAALAGLTASLSTCSSKARCINSPPTI